MQLETQQEYYYLIAGLPDIVLEQSKVPCTLVELVEELRENLQPKDFEKVQLLLLDLDNRNLLHWLQHKDIPREQLARYSPEELEEGLKEEESDLPDYMHRFAEAYRNEQPIWPGMSWENQLTRLYFDYVLAKTTGFLHDHFTFEQDLRNLLVGWNSREYDIPLEGQLIGENEITHAIQHQHSRTFGLEREVEYFDRLEHILEQDNLFEREGDIDRLRWQVIEQRTTFHYFTVERVLGYFLQFRLLLRWLKLDQQRGQQLIRKKIQILEEQYLERK